MEIVRHNIENLNTLMYFASRSAWLKPDHPRIHVDFAGDDQLRLLNINYDSTESTVLLSLRSIEENLHYFSK